MPYRILSAVLNAAESAGELPPGRILGFDKTLLISLGIQWINIALLTAVLIFILYKPVKKFMADRSERIRGDIASARQNSEDASILW